MYKSELIINEGLSNKHSPIQVRKNSESPWVDHTIFTNKGDSTDNKYALSDLSTQKFIKSINKDLFYHHKRLIFYKDYNYTEIKLRFQRYARLLFLIDLIGAILDFVIVNLLYFEHDDLVYNGYILSEEWNVIRWVCLVLTLFVCILIGVRIPIKEKCEDLKFLLNKREKVCKNQLKIKSLFIEIILHLIQPYPYIQLNWVRDYMGKDVIYNWSAILFSFIYLRIYMFGKVIKHLNIFTDDRSRRIFRYFKNRNFNMFLFKSNIKKRGFLTLLFIFLVCLFSFSYLFNVYEDFDPMNKSIFSKIDNCLWYLVQTMTTIGYGDKAPNTLPGRIIGFFCCLIGIISLTLLVITLLIHVILTEDEEKAYKEINTYHTKAQNNNYISYYFYSFLKYKLHRFKKKRPISEFFMAWNDYKIMYEKFSIQIRAGLKTPFDIDRFGSKLFEIWENGIVDANYMFTMNLKNISEALIPISESYWDNINEYKIAKQNSFRMHNLAKIMSSIGSKFEINDSREIRTEMMISNKNMEMKIREFQVRYRDRLIRDRSDLKKYTDKNYSEGYSNTDPFSAIQSSSEYSSEDY